MIKNIKKTNFYLRGVESKNRGGNRRPLKEWWETKTNNN